MLIEQQKKDLSVNLDNIVAIAINSDQKNEIGAIMPKQINTTIILERYSTPRRALEVLNDIKLKNRSYDYEISKINRRMQKCN